MFRLLVQVPHSTRLIEFAVGFEGREDGEVFVAEHAHYEDFAEVFREMELEDDALGEQESEGLASWFQRFAHCKE